MTDGIPEESYDQFGNKKEERKEYKKPEILEGSGRIDRISKQEKGDGKTYYRLTIGNTFYTMWVNKDEDEVLLESLKDGDQVKFTWTGKAIGDKTFRNIRWIEKLTGDKKLNDFPSEDFRKKNVEGMTFGMAMNNAVVLLAKIATTKDNPEEWLTENIGGPYWKAIEQKLHKNYVEQRQELIGE